MVFLKKMFVPFDQNFEFQFYRTDVKDDRSTGLHFHDCLEINYCLEGEGFLLIDDKRLEFSPGSFYFINNLEVHEAVSTNHLRIIVIMFQPSIIDQNHAFDYRYIQPFFPKNISYSNCLAAEESVLNRLRKLLFEMEEEMQQKQTGYQMMVKAILMQFLGLVYRNLNQYESTPEQRDAAKSYNRLRPVLEYINLHFGEEQFFLDQLASLVHMNRTYFSTYFKKVMQTGVFDYINRLRIERACTMLAGTDRPVAEIALGCGFENISYFNRRFKQQVGQTPLQYRNEKTRFLL